MPPEYDKDVDLKQNESCGTVETTWETCSRGLKTKSQELSLVKMERSMDF